MTLFQNDAVPAVGGVAYDTVAQAASQFAIDANGTGGRTVVINSGNTVDGVGAVVLVAGAAFTIPANTTQFVCYTPLNTLVMEAAVSPGNFALWQFSANATTITGATDLRYNFAQIPTVAAFLTQGGMDYIAQGATAAAVSAAAAAASATAAAGSATAAAGSATAAATSATNAAGSASSAATSATNAANQVTLATTQATNAANSATAAAGSATSAAGSAAAAASSATSSANSAISAASSAASAAASANATQWISLGGGGVYLVGECVWSPITFLTYRNKTGANTNNDPSVDGTNWALLLASGDPQWVVKNASFNALVGEPVMVDSSAAAPGAIIITFPATPLPNDVILLDDYKKTFPTNYVTINFNGNKWEQQTVPGTLDIDLSVRMTWTYIDNIIGWEIS